MNQFMIEKKLWSWLIQAIIVCLPSGKAHIFKLLFLIIVISDFEKSHSKLSFNFG